MRTSIRYIIGSVALAGLVTTASADDGNTATGIRNISIKGRKDVTITTPGIQLGDVAEVTGNTPLDDETVIGLKRITIADSPRPGKETDISASQILERMRDEGVNLGRVGYTFPRILKVRRASRLLSVEEIQNAIERYLKKSGSDSALQHVDYRGDVQISPGDVDIEAIPFSVGNPSQKGFDVSVKVNDIEEVRLNVRASVEDWKEIPIAARTLNKGSIVGPEDVRMARLNVNSLPRDVATEDGGVIGREVGVEVAQGDFFRAGKLAVPPVITAGQSVTLRYRIKSLEATASGVAMEPGVRGQEIRVRNPVSKRVLTGAVVEPGLVEVRGQTAVQN